MSLIMKIAGADFSESGLPKLKQTVLGFPGEGLAGLYLFEDGAVDAVHTSSFLDSSGRKNNAVLFSDFAAPVNRSYGLEVTDVAGLILDTGIPQGADFTVVACLKNTIDTAPQDGFPTWFGDIENGIPVNKAGTGSNSPRFAPNMSLSSDSNNNGLYGLLGMFPNGASRVSVNEVAYGRADEPAIISFKVSADSVDFSTLSGFSYSAVDPDIATAYAGSAGNMTIGLWTHGTYSTSITGQLYAFAIYERALSDVEISEAMAAMNSRVAARGITVFA